MMEEKDLLEYENIGRKIKRSDKYPYVDASSSIGATPSHKKGNDDRAIGRADMRAAFHSHTHLNCTWTLVYIYTTQHNHATHACTMPSCMPFQHHEPILAREHDLDDLVAWFVLCA